MVGQHLATVSIVFIWEIFFIQLNKTAACAVNSLIDDKSHRNFHNSASESVITSGIKTCR